MPYPVHVVHTQQLDIPTGIKLTLKNHRTFPIINEFWQVTTKLVGDCGHEHTTEDEAREQCFDAMTNKWREARWGKKVS